MSPSNDHTDSSALVPEGDGSPHPTLGQRARTFDGQPTIQTEQGLTMPRLGIGTWQLDDDEVVPIVAEGLRLGYRHIDTAQGYGNEAGVGRGLGESGVARSEVFLTTKVGNDAHEPDDLVRSVESSLEALGTDHVDLLLLHWPVEWNRIGATLATLAQVQAGGLAHHIGVSNFTIEQLELAKDHAPLEVLQAECHPFLQQRELRAWCVEHDWLFTAYSPIAQGRVTDSPELVQLANELGDDVGAIEASLAWLLSLDRVACIPRTSSVDHLASNLRALELGMTAEQAERVRGIETGERVVDPPNAPWSD